MGGCLESKSSRPAWEPSAPCPAPCRVCSVFLGSCEDSVLALCSGPDHSRSVLQKALSCHRIAVQLQGIGLLVPHDKAHRTLSTHTEPGPAGRLCGLRLLPGPGQPHPCPAPTLGGKAALLGVGGWPSPQRLSQAGRWGWAALPRPLVTHGERVGSAPRGGGPGERELAEGRWRWALEDAVSPALPSCRPGPSSCLLLAPRTRPRAGAASPAQLIMWKIGRNCGRQGGK